MILLSTSMGYQAAISLRELLLGISFILCLLGMIENLWKECDRTKAFYNSIIVTFIIAGLIVGYPKMLDELRTAFASVHSDYQKIPLLEKLYTTKISAGEAPSKWDIGNYICYVGVLTMQKLGYFSVRILVWFQEFAINGLIAVSPILLGFLATSFTRSIGVNFLMTSLGVVIWHLGFTIVDLVLYHFSNSILLVSGLSAAASGTALAFGIIGWPVALAGMLLIVILSNAMYLSVPFITQALLKGANPVTSALGAGIQSASTAMGMGVGAKFALGQLSSSQPGVGLLGSVASSLGQDSSSQGSLGNSMSQLASSSGGSFSSSKNSGSNFNGDNNGQESGFSGGSSNASGSSSSGMPTPPLTKPFTAKPGDSVSQGNFTATQSSPGAFTLSNNQAGTTSQQIGNIGSPQDLTAGINLHDVKRNQPSPASSSSSGVSQQRQQLDQKLSS